jgi:hypothetical protein
VRRKKASTRRPHKLALYRRAVQHPDAEAAFLDRVYGHYKKTAPLLLREDFAGTCAVASAWVRMDDEHQAMAVESHGPTVRWAQRVADMELGDRVDDLHVVQGDVMAVDGPRVDVTCALNFSTFIYHDRATLKQYFKAARRGLRRDGMLVIDAYGGPGAMRVGTQSRRVPGDDSLGAVAGDGFTYQWEQRAFDPITHRTECRIHFELDGGKRIESAFIYRWRLWGLPELTGLMLESGFKRVEVWCDRFDAAAGISDGVYRSIRKSPAREDWVAYVVGVK